jgi:energy-coupling factor transporter transmembrane protein EcfT
MWLRYRLSTILIVVALIGFALATVACVMSLNSLEKIGLLFVTLGIGFMVGCFLFPLIVLGITSLILDHVQANRHYEPDGLKRGNEDHRGLAEKSPEIVE